MANERAIDKQVVAIVMDIRTKLKMRKIYAKEGDTTQDYMMRALTELVKDVKLTVREEEEARRYCKERYDKRMQKRLAKNGSQTL